MFFLTLLSLTYIEFLKSLITLNKIIFQKTLPMRHKEVHGINTHPSMKFALDFGMSLISEKIKSRVRLYTNLEEALENGQLERDTLPKEYGGTIPMKEMIRKLF